MKKSISLCILFLLFACSSSITGNVVVDSVHINAEIADTAEERAKGLMFREELCRNCGMLFVFDESSKHSFWMKNTLIPLDMIFIDENFGIVDILEAEPCVTDICESYSQEAKYVLEVNQGFCKENNIEIGDELLIR